MGGRKGLCTDYALFTVIEAIYQAWQEGKQCAVLALEIQGAFNNVSHQRLLHNLRKRGIGGEWLEISSRDSSKSGIPN